MTSFQNNSQITVKLPADHPELLAGLDRLLILGLISDSQVKRICRQELICNVIFTHETEPEEVITPSYVPPQRKLISPLPMAEKVQKKPNFITKILQSLGEELSVRWLLFLGIFLVVLSSGVLAASQWEKFPAIAQYGVLFLYTLSFCGFTFWANKQNNLRLTAQTLLIVTLLLIPINFWAMDTFNLWENKLNWLLIAIASFILSFITNKLCQSSVLIPNFPPGKLPIINILCLSYLQWGWHFKIFPLLAAYLAMIGTTFLTVYYQLTQEENHTEEQRNKTGFYLYLWLIIYGLLVILCRAIFLFKVNIEELSLAIGICGSLVIWLAQKNLSNSLLWENCGLGVMFLGWLFAVEHQPLQGTLISISSIYFLYNRLTRYNLENDLTGIFVISLQTMWLIWRLVPENLQKLIITTANYWTNSQYQSWSLLSIALFPHIIFMLWISNNLAGKNQKKLSNWGQNLTLCLGGFLTFISLVEPAIRTVNLLFYTVIVFIFAQKRFTEFSALIYINHTLGLLTLFSAINLFFPTLNKEIWASILLILMVIEWIFSLGDGIWKRSGWYLGLVLAGISFTLLLFNVQTYYWNGNFFHQVNKSNYWGVIWLITPLSLTSLASFKQETQSENKRLLSIISVGMAQLLTLPLPGVRLITLGVGFGILLFNNRYFINVLYARIIIAFSLSFVTAILLNLFTLNLSDWFIFGSIIILSLWLLRSLFLRINTELFTTYAIGSNQFAMTLCLGELLGMSLNSTLVYEGVMRAEFSYFIATFITLIAIIYRIWKQPTNLAFYGIGWCLELLIFQICSLGEYSSIKIIIANLVLGFITQLFGEWWKRKYQLQILPNSFHILPILYSVFSVILRTNIFTDWTGFCTLGVALILIGVGRRQETFKPLIYLGLIGVSISAYELLFYQMFQIKVGVLGDGLIAMAALGTTIMYIYRILNPWLINYLKLSEQTLKNISHLHWTWSSFLLIITIIFPGNINLYLGLGTGVFLSYYAIWQGKQNSENNNDYWVYLGLIEFGFVAIYLNNIPILQLIGQELLPFMGAISCLFAYLCYILPWENWGWNKTPWQRTSYILPVIFLGFTAIQTFPITLIITAVYYIFLAKITHKIRFTYVSTILIDWAIFRFFNQLNIRESFYYIIHISLSILYIAQVEPKLQIPESKKLRHNLRILGSGLIGGWTILFYQNQPFIPAIFSILGIFAGLGLKIRAFLYVGTGVFMITSIYQLVIFSYSYSFLKWIIGLLLGIMLIYIAANFETRRSQIISLWRNISDEFENWD